MLLYLFWFAVAVALAWPPLLFWITRHLSPRPKLVLRILGVSVFLCLLFLAVAIPYLTLIT